MKKSIAINEEYITLGQFLKLADVISTGGQAKWYLSEHDVLVNQEYENRRGRKIYPGYVVEIPDEGTFFVQKMTDDTDEI